MNLETNAAYKKRIMDKEIVLWRTFVPRLLKKMDIKTPINVVDIGGARGSLLLAFNQEKKLNNGKLIEKFFSDLQEEFLNSYNLDEKFFNENKIKIHNMDGNRFQIEKGTDLLVKTYCHEVEWQNLNLINTKFILTNIHAIQDNFLNSCHRQGLEFEILYQFNITKSAPKTPQAFRKPFLLIKLTPISND